MSEETPRLIVWGHDERAFKFFLFFLVGGVAFLGFAIVMIDPEWEANSPRGRLLQLLPPIVRSGALGVGGAVLLKLAVFAWRLYRRRQQAELTREGVSALTIHGRRHAAWRDVIEVRSLGYAVRVRTRKPTWFDRLVWNRNDIFVRAGGLTVTPNGPVLDFIHAIRPDLLPGHVVKAQRSKNDE